MNVRPTTRADARHDPQAGARNLLINCAGVAPSDRVLIAYEPAHYGYFTEEVLHEVRLAAEALGADVHTLDVGYAPSHAGLPEPVMKQLAETDVVVFLSRLGDQLRFSELPTGPKYVVCFAFNGTLLGSSFGTAHYAAFCEAKAAVDARLFAAREIRITCPAGTDVRGAVTDAASVPQDTTSTRFPMSVFSPVPAAGFSGRVALGGFLTGTGASYYDDYTLSFAGPVFALLNAGRLAGFEGAAEDVAKAEAHYDRVAALFDLDRSFVHSWHAGIHPGCGFYWDLFEEDKRWGGAAFGNPRILHFHTCGAEPPGEISWNLFDPTIEVDGVRLWEHGRFHLERLEEGRCILASYPDVAKVFAEPDRNIGLAEEA
ncbi:MAG: hypothetical protein AAGA71_01925 [Pseudomonadota bacterium]